MRWRRIIAAVMTGVLSGLLLAGCWDRKEIEDTAFVLALGLDKGEEGKVAVTVQLAVPRQIAGQQGQSGKAGGGAPAVTQRFEQPTVSEALRDLETFTSRRISMVHLKVLVIGRELAEAGFYHHLGILTRYREKRRTVMMMIADGTAEEILTLEAAIERDPALYLEDLTRRAYERTARAPRIDLHRFLLAFETLAQEAVVPVVRVRTVRPGMEGPVQKAQLLGAALFEKARMVGMLTPEETETYMMLTGLMDSFIETVVDPQNPEGKVVAEMTEEQRQVRFTPGHPVRIEMDVKTEAELREIQAREGAQMTPATLAEIDKALSERLTRKANALVRKLQQEYKVDIVGFGHYVKMRFLDWPSWVSYDWPKQFPNAEIRINVQSYIRRVGMTVQPVEHGDLSKQER